MRTRLVLILLVLGVAGSSAEAARLRLEGPWQPGQFAAVEVDAAGAGPHVLAGENVMPVQWPGGTRVTLPVLVYSGTSAVRLTLDGRPVTLETAAEGKAILPDAGGPAVGLIDPRPYAATAGWRPGRPPTERRLFAIGAVAFAVLGAAALWLVRRPGRRLLVIAAVCVAATAGVLLWDRLRPALAIRRADVSFAGGVDRWYFAAGPQLLASPQTLRVAFVGQTRPVAFSRRHLDALSPTLLCDAAGRPLELRLSLGPGTQAAVVQRVGDGPTTPPPDWARPLLRGVYGR